ncbi:peptidase C39 family protein [Leucobacter allii]|uniref:peptidase C39 family protein n=1 Tax=Leucobacter allii TaxID=2932247 RepID=UPI001FD214CD|nr:peptidase C39 family protein [Leucobacter allii]UOR00727.1 peptidase C39 family protein [Leucobacter allii]
MTPITPAGIELGAEPGTAFPEPLRGFAGGARVASWETERALWAPRTLLARDAGGGLLGAALTAGRPFAAYRKIVDVIAEDDATWAALVRAARDDAAAVSESRPEPIVVHFEHRAAFGALPEERRAELGRLGFVPARVPVPSVPSTRSGAPEEVEVWSWWRGGRAPALPPYYGQTTDVTCGAVSSLMALGVRGEERFEPEDLAGNRAAEIGFWRRATNLPACEPIGLAVETAKELRAADPAAPLPAVVLSAAGPVLVEDFGEEWDRALRVELQEESLRQAGELGLEVSRRWIEVSEIAELIAGGALVLLLIDLTELIADPTPHWVLACDVLDGSIVVADPWVNAETGETWADTYALPLPFDTVDRVTRWGDPAYRGVVVIPPAAG